MARDPRELDWQRSQRHRFLRPSPDLADDVAHYWEVTWEYVRPYRQLVVPYPNVHLTFNRGIAQVRGVSSGYVLRDLSGTGRVFGVAFRPGRFRPYLGRPVRSITDRSVPAADVFDDLPVDAEVGTVEAMLRTNRPDDDPKARIAAEVVDRIVAQPAITRVDVLAGELAMSVRQLQRLFVEHVGVGPKWVIRRYRLHEVTERMAGNAAIDWSALAAELGYADQAHFVRDFTAMFGETPTTYGARYRASRSDREMKIPR